MILSALIEVAHWNARVASRDYEKKFLDGLMSASMELAEAVIDNQIYDKHT
jgi:hypothetical protein